MPTYRKKPVEIEAVCLTVDNASEVSEWITDNGGGAMMGRADGQLVYFMIYTPEGRMDADEGDWIVQGVEGEFYPVKPSIFEKTYEAC